MNGTHAMLATAYVRTNKSSATGGLKHSITNIRVLSHFWAIFRPYSMKYEGWNIVCFIQQLVRRRYGVNQKLRNILQFQNCHYIEDKSYVHRPIAVNFWRFVVFRAIRAYLHLDEADHASVSDKNSWVRPTKLLQTTVWNKTVSCEFMKSTCWNHCLRQLRDVI